MNKCLREVASAVSLPDTEHVPEGVSVSCCPIAKLNECLREVASAAKEQRLYFVCNLCDTPLSNIENLFTDSGCCFDPLSFCPAPMFLGGFKFIFDISILRVETVPRHFATTQSRVHAFPALADACC